MFIQLIHGEDERVITPLDPNEVAVSCEAKGWDVSSWFGKANSVVARRGINPSYGSFLINADDAAYIRENVIYLDIYLETDEKDENQYKSLTGKNFQVYTLESITPSYEGKGSIYFLQLVDHRANIPGVDMGLLHDRNENINREYINLVIHHDGTDFIYDEQTTKPYTETFSGESTGGDGVTTTALGWKQTFETLLMLRCGGFYSGSSAFYPKGTSNAFQFIDAGITYPEVPPQNVHIGLHDDIAASLYKLLFAINCDLLYDGEGKYTLVEIKDQHDVAGGQDANIFEEHMQFDDAMLTYTDGAPPPNLVYAILSDKKYELTRFGQTSLLPENLIGCSRWVPTHTPGISSVEYKKEVVPVFGQLDPKKDVGPGICYVEVPFAWTKTYNDSPSSSPFTWYKNLWGNKKDTLLWSFPPKNINLCKWVDVSPNAYIQQVCWYNTSAFSGGTWVRNVLPIDWEKLKPLQVGISSPDIITGRTTAKVNTSTTTFNIKDIKLVHGVDPRDDISSVDETVNIENTPQVEVEVNKRVYAIRSSTTYRWQLISGSGSSSSTGGGGDITNTIIRFKLKEDLERGTAPKQAHIIDLANNTIGSDGNPILEESDVPLWQADQPINEGDFRKAPTADPIGVPPAWQAGDIIKSKSTRQTGLFFNSQESIHWELGELPDGLIVVVDQEGKRYGYGPYDDPQFGEQDGYIGTAYKIADDYDGFGHPGYQILDMEAEARWIEGTVVDGTQQEGSGEVNPSFLMEVDRYWGASPNNRPPKTSVYETGVTGEEDKYVIQVFIRNGGSTPPDNAEIRALLDDEAAVYILESNAVDINFSVGMALITGEVSAAVLGQTHLELGSGTAVEYVQDTTGTAPWRYWSTNLTLPEYKGPDDSDYTTAPAFYIFNMNAAPVAVGKVVLYKMFGTIPIRVIDEKDCG